MFIAAVQAKPVDRKLEQNARVYVLVSSCDTTQVDRLDGLLFNGLNVNVNTGVSWLLGWLVGWLCLRLRPTRNVPNRAP
jgi:hypothetical protein